MNIYTSIARNCMPNITRNVYTVLNKMMKEGDQLVIYENNSTDFTREFLLDIEKTHNNFHYIYEDLENPPNFPPVALPERIHYLASCRNRYLDYIKNTFKNSDIEHVIVFDSDMHTIYQDNFDTMITEHAAVGSNGVDVWIQNGEQKACQYDTYSRLMLDSNKVHYGQDLIVPEPSNGLVEVRSVFGGIAVYRWEFMKHCTYQWVAIPGSTTDQRYINSGLCEHAGLALDIRSKGGKVYINTEYYPIRNKLF